VPIVAVLHHLERPFLGHVATLREAGVTLDERRLRAGDALPDREAIDGAVLLGGEQSLTGDVAGFAGEMAWLREAVARELPVLGICLGGQMLARALGGEVRRAGRVVEWRDLPRTPAGAEDPVFGALPDPVPALHWNEDVFEPPPGAVELLARGGPGAEAFRAGACAWGVQYHPDVDLPTLEEWYAEWGADVAAAGRDLAEIRAEDARRAGAQAAASRALFAAFAREVARRGA